MTSPVISDIFGVRIPNPTVIRSLKPVETSNPDLIMGMELEIENCDHTDEWYINAVNKLGWQVTVDHSLRGANVGSGNNAGIENNAFEFISKPMASGYLLAALQAFFDVTKFDEDNYTDRCSVHVHVNCTNLIPEQVSGVSLLYSVLEEALFRFVGEHRDSNIYCMPWSQCRLNYDIVERMCRDMPSATRSWQKYTALNLLPLREHGTVEFRHMHGTADMKKLTTWVNMIGSMFRYATATPLPDLIKEIKSLNSNSEYESFFNKTLGSILPYDDTYRPALEAGVICAKYGLMTWGKPRKEGGVSVSFDELLSAPTEDSTITYRVPIRPMPWDQVAAAAAAEDRDVDVPPSIARPAGRATRATPATAFSEAHNRFLPWPRTGTNIPFGGVENAPRLNDEEVRFLYHGSVQPLWTSQRFGMITVTSQPSFTTRNRLGIRTQENIDRVEARMRAEAQEDEE